MSPDLGRNSGGGQGGSSEYDVVGSPRTFSVAMPADSRREKNIWYSNRSSLVSSGALGRESHGLCIYLCVFIGMYGLTCVSC